MLAKAYDSVDLAEDEEVRLFGTRREFLGNPGSKNRKPGNVYHSLGDAPRSVDTHTASAHTALANKVWEDMPVEMKKVIPKTCIGKFVDGDGRDYTPRADDPNHEEYGTYEVRLPIKRFKNEDALLMDDQFPQDNEILHLTGRGVRRVCRVKGDTYNRRVRIAFIDLEVLQETRLNAT